MQTCHDSTDSAGNRYVSIFEGGNSAPVRVLQYDPEGRLVYDSQGSNDTVVNQYHDSVTVIPTPGKMVTFTMGNENDEQNLIDDFLVCIEFRNYDRIKFLLADVMYHSIINRRLCKARALERAVRGLIE